MQSTVSELIARARKGDATSLGRLLDAYRERLRRSAQHHLGPQMQAKVSASDIVQETFLEAHRQFPTFGGDSEGQLIAWLRKILGGTVGGFVRRFLGTQARDLRRERDFADSSAMQGRSRSMSIPSPVGTPSEMAMNRERVAMVVVALERLPPQYREVITLRHAEHLTFSEIAARTGRSVDAVEKLWLRGVQLLRRKCRED